MRRLFAPSGGNKNVRIMNPEAGLSDQIPVIRNGTNRVIQVLYLGLCEHLSRCKICDFFSSFRILRSSQFVPSYSIPESNHKAI